MKFVASKTPLLIAAIAAAVTLTSLTQANAAAFETGTNATNVQLVERDLAATGTFNRLGTSNQRAENKGAPKQSFAKKKTYEPKYSFSKKKGLSRLF